MNITISIMKSITCSSLWLVIALVILSQKSHATILVIDMPDNIFTPNNISISTSHLGNDSISLRLESGGDFAVYVSGDGNPRGGMQTLGFIGSFSQGSDIVPDIGFLASTYALVIFGDHGAGDGLNYARFDLNGDSVYETVVEFNFGDVLDFSDDSITRYAYDSNGSSLNIQEAVNTLNSVPEPTSCCLLLLSLGGFLTRRCRC